MASRVRRSRRILQSALAGLFGPLAFTALHCSSPEPDKRVEAREITVEVTTLAPETFVDIAPLSGQLEAEYSVMVKPEIEGVIDTIAFEEGQSVAKDDVLFGLRSGEQRARLREAKAELALAQSVYARTKELASRQVSSAAQQERAVAEREIARARLQLARIEVERTQVRAPFDGVVGTRFVSPGDRVEPGDPLVQIDAVDRLQVVFGLSERYVAEARTGVPVAVRVAAYPSERFPGEIFYVSPSLDAVARRVILKAWVPNPDRRLRAGMFANVEVEVSRRDDAILISEAAVVYDRQGTYVWRIDAEERAQRVPVRLGLRSEGRVQVQGGLAPGDVVVVAGTHKLKEGSKIRRAETQPTTQARERGGQPPAVGGGT